MVLSSVATRRSRAWTCMPPLPPKPRSRPEAAQAVGGLLQAHHFFALLHLGLFERGLLAFALAQVSRVGAARLFELMGELVEPQDLVDVAVEQFEVVRDDQQAAAIGAEEL